MPEDKRFKGESNKGYYYRTNSEQTEYKIIFKGAEEITVSDNTDDFARYDSSCTGKTHPPNDYAVYYDNDPGQDNGAECW